MRKSNLVLLLALFSLPSCAYVQKVRGAFTDDCYQLIAASRTTQNNVLERSGELYDEGTLSAETYMKIFEATDHMEQAHDVLFEACEAERKD